MGLVDGTFKGLPKDKKNAQAASLKKAINDAIENAIGKGIGNNEPTK